MSVNVKNIDFDADVEYDPTGNVTQIIPCVDEDAVIYKSKVGTRALVSEYGWPHLDDDAEKPVSVPFAVKIRLGQLSEANRLRCIPVGIFDQVLFLRKRVADIVLEDIAERGQDWKLKCYTFSWVLTDEMFVVERSRTRADNPEKRKQNFLRDFKTATPEEQLRMLAELQAMTSAE